MIYLQIFNRPSIVLNSAKAMEDLLNKRGLRYSDRPDTILVTEMCVRLLFAYASRISDSTIVVPW